MSLRHWHPTAHAAAALFIASRLGGAQPPTIGAPPPRPSATVSGVVYDSITSRAIAGATIEFVNANDPAARPTTAVSGADGRYSIRDLPPGSYLAGFFTPALDSLGLEAAPRRVEVSTTTQRVDLATPSARTVIATICPAGSANDSTGMLIGHVRSTDDQMAIGGASVMVEWSETIIDGSSVRQRTPRVTGQSAEPGFFAICGLPSGAVLQARAFNASDSSGFIEIDVPANGLRYTSFLVGGAALVPVPADDTSAAAGTTRTETAWRGRARLSGIVVDHTGKPVVNAHALIWRTGVSATTNERGAFTLEGLPGGTQTLEIRVIGYVPVTSVVQLAESRPATTNVVLAKSAEILSTVTVRGEMVYSRNLAEFDRRRRSGFGTFRTSEEIGKRGPSVKLSQLLQDVLGVQVERRGAVSVVTMMRGATTGIGRASCTPSLFVDGINDRVRDYDAYYADDIAGIEVYARESTRPFEFIDPQNPCGAVAIWTRTVPRKPKTPPDSP